MGQARAGHAGKGGGIERACSVGHIGHQVAMSGEATGRGGGEVEGPGVGVNMGFVAGR